MRVIEDVRFNAIVQRCGDLYVLNAILSHPVHGLLVTLKYQTPEAETFVLHLGPNSKKWGDVRKTVHHKAKTLDSLDKINGRGGCEGFQSFKKKVAFNLGQIVLVTVVTNNRIRFVEKFSQSFSHGMFAVSPFREEHKLFRANPVSTEAEETARINQLVGGDVLIIHPPDVRLSGSPLYVNYE
jgi:hypothetical protein